MATVENAPAAISKPQSSGHSRTESEQLDDDFQKIRVASSAFVGGSASVVHEVDDKDRMNKNKWTVPGIATRLYGHQVIGAGTMIDLEKGVRKVAGGILADEMGLGSEYSVQSSSASYSKLKSSNLRLISFHRNRDAADSRRERAAQRQEEARSHSARREVQSVCPNAGRDHGPHGPASGGGVAEGE